MQNIFQALKSKTVWVAILQAVLGVIIVILTEADLAGYAMMIKSLGDVVLRAITTQPLSEK